MTSPKLKGNFVWILLLSFLLVGFIPSESNLSDCEILPTGELSISKLSINGYDDPMLIINEGENTTLNIEFVSTEDGVGETTVEFGWELNGESGISEWTGNLLEGISITHLISDMPFDELEVGETYDLTIEISSVNGVGVSEIIQKVAIVIVQPAEDHFAIDFANNSDYIRFFDANAVPTGNEAWTVESWTKGNNGRTVVQVGYSGTNKKRFILGLTGLKPHIDAGGPDETISSPSNIDQGKWTHLAGTYDGDTLKLIVDGVLIEAKAIANLNIEDSTLYIGYRIGSSGTVTGLLDNIRVWNYARSEEQIKLNMSRFVDAADDEGLVFNLTVTPGEFDFPNAKVTETASASLGQLISMPDPSVLVTPGAPVLDGLLANDFQLTSYVIAGEPRSPYEVTTIVNETETADSVSVLVINNGVNALTSLNLNWSVNGIDQPVVNWTGSIPSFETHEITLAVDYIFEADSTYEIEVVGSLPNGVSIPAIETQSIDAFVIVQPSEDHFAIDFANNSDYIRFADANEVPTGNEAWTVEAWTKDNNGKTLLQVGYSNTNKERIILGLTGLKPHIDTGGPNETINSVTNISEGKWTHIAGTYDGDTLKLIVDGVLIEAKEISNLSIEDSTVYVGRKLSSSSTALGQLDNIRIWDYARTTEQIKLNMSRFVDATDDEGLVFNLAVTPGEFDFPNGKVTETASGSLGQLISMPDPSVLVTPGAPVLDGLLTDDFQLTSLIIAGEPRSPYEVTTIVNETETADSISVLVINDGVNLLTSLTLNWSVNGIDQPVVNWTGSIPSFETHEITLAVDYIFEADSTYEIEVVGSLPNGVSIPAIETQSIDAFVIVQPSEDHFAIDFANNSDYIRFADANEVPTGNEAWTVEVWTKDNNGKTLLQVGYSNTNKERIILGLTGLKPHIDTGGPNETINSVTNISEGKWTHIAGTYDGDTLKLIVDGVLIEAKEISNLSIEDSTVYVGRKLSSSSTALGQLDNIRIWDYARTTEQIKLNMSRFVDATDDEGLVFNLAVTPGEFDFPNGKVTETASGSLGTLYSIPDASVLVNPGAPVLDGLLFVPPVGSVSIQVEWNTACGNRNVSIDISSQENPSQNQLILASVDLDGIVQATQLQIGTYDISLTIEGFLTKAILNMEIVEGQNILEFDSLVVGDLNGDNVINNVDLSSIVIAFGSNLNSSNYNIIADFNCDEVINIIDISILSAGYGLVGDGVGQSFSIGNTY